jgi:hypothetical protein
VSAWAAALAFLLVTATAARAITAPLGSFAVRGLDVSAYQYAAARYARGAGRLPLEVDLENDPYAATDHTGDCCRRHHAARRGPRRR